MKISHMWTFYFKRRKYPSTAAKRKAIICTIPLLLKLQRCKTVTPQFRTLIHVRRCPSVIARWCRRSSESLQSEEFSLGRPENASNISFLLCICSHFCFPCFGRRFELSSSTRRKSSLKRKPCSFWTPLLQASEAKVASFITPVVKLRTTTEKRHTKKYFEVTLIAC